MFSLQKKIRLNFDSSSIWLTQTSLKSDSTHLSQSQVKFDDSDSCVSHDSCVEHNPARQTVMVTRAQETVMVPRAQEIVCLCRGTGPAEVSGSPSPTRDGSKVALNYPETEARQVSSRRRPTRRVT